MNAAFWVECRETFQKLGKDGSVRAIVLSGGQSKHFTVGLDLKDKDLSASLMPSDGEHVDAARRAVLMRNLILTMQESFNAIEKCPQPVIAAIHGACIGGGIDMITACDIRMCSADAWYSIKEVDIGLAADVGTLQRISHVIGSASLVRDLAYTARKMDSAEALSCGFVSRVLPTKEETLNKAMEMAKEIATKSPIAIFGTKHNLNYSRDHTLTDSLAYMATWNAAYLQTVDMTKAGLASITKSEAPEFDDLHKAKL